MADNFELAGQAIEAVVETYHPDDANQWAAIVPMDDKAGWGLALAEWSVLARTILKKFNALIAPDTVQVSDAEIINCGQLSLDNFQLDLSNKADAGA